MLVIEDVKVSFAMENEKDKLGINTLENINTYINSMKEKGYHVKNKLDTISTTIEFKRTFNIK